VEKTVQRWDSPSIIILINSRMTMGVGQTETKGVGGEVTQVGYGKESQRERRPLGSPRYRWVDNVQLDLRNTVWDSLDGVGLVQDRGKPFGMR
jgi:hypothetical protein